MVRHFGHTGFDFYVDLCDRNMPFYNPIPINMIMCNEETNLSVIDKVSMICAGSRNFCDSVQGWSEMGGAFSKMWTSR